jgi:hypothetical protein
MPRTLNRGRGTCPLVPSMQLPGILKGMISLIPLGSSDSMLSRYVHFQSDKHASITRLADSGGALSVRNHKEDVQNERTHK